MMTKDEALKMAIDAMRTCDYETETWSVVDIALAINACKEALEQKTVLERDYNFMRDLAIGTEDILNEMLSAKPVYVVGKGWNCDNLPAEGTELYTHSYQRQELWQKLTVEEIKELNNGKG